MEKSDHPFISQITVPSHLLGPKKVNKGHTQSFSLNPLSRPVIAGKDKSSPGFPSSSHNFFFWPAREMKCLLANSVRQRPGSPPERKQLITSFPYKHGLSVNKCQLSAENEIQELSQLGREVFVHRSGGDSPGTQREPWGGCCSLLTRVWLLQNT